MKQLPEKLESFILDLSYDNNLGEKDENIQLLIEGMKKLPYNLKNLELYLSEINLGENHENFKKLMEIMKQLPNSLQYLKLDLYLNNFG